jgi:S-adenosylmethionine synthetase
MAKNVVAAGIAKRCTIQLSYAIGVSEPLSLYVDLGPEADVDPQRLETFFRDSMSLTPRGIREKLALNKPIYRRSAAYGHFGRTPDGDFFPWERTDLVDDLKAAF